MTKEIGTTTFKPKLVPKKKWDNYPKNEFLCGAALALFSFIVLTCDGIDPDEIWLPPLPVDAQPSKKETGFATAALSLDSYDGMISLVTAYYRVHIELVNDPNGGSLEKVGRDMLYVVFKKSIELGGYPCFDFFEEADG